MSVTNGISLVFVCKSKSCYCSFGSLDSFIDHKKEKHSLEFEQVKCIVFEEKENATLSSVAVPPPPRSCTDDDTEAKESMWDFKRNHFVPDASISANPIEPTLDFDNDMDISNIMSDEEHIIPQLETRPFICDVCGMEFRTPLELSSLLPSLSDTDDRSFKCPRRNCSKAFKNVNFDDLAIGFRNTSTKVTKKKKKGKTQTENVPVTEGEVVSAEDSDIKMEMKVSEPEPIKKVVEPEPIPTVIGKKEGTQSQVKDVETIDRPFKCKVENCQSAFVKSNGLKFHMKKKHRNEGEPKNFVCEVCEKAFYTEKELKFHSVVHSDDKPFACTYKGCTSAYKHKYKLAKHRKTHKNVDETTTICN